MQLVENQSNNMTKAEIKKAEKELSVPVIPKMDLSEYFYIQNENPKFKIGVLSRKLSGLTSFEKGEIVLFRPYTVEESYGNMLWAEMEKHVKLCTMEVPNSRYFTGESRISTNKTIVGVPLEFIEYEITINNAKKANKNKVR